MPASSLASEAADKAEKTILDTEKVVHDLAQRAERVVQDSLESLRTRSRAYADDAERSLDHAQKYVLERVYERPLTTTVAALGVGMLVGLLFIGRRR